MFVPLMLSSLIGATAMPPVTLATCEVSTPITQPDGDVGPTTVGGFYLHVRFSNTAQQPISRVTFALDDGARISDVGTFSPGIAIDHTLGLKSAAAGSCAVTAVEFADGATWHAY